MGLLNAAQYRALREREKAAQAASFDPELLDPLDDLDALCEAVEGFPVGRRSVRGCVPDVDLVILVPDDLLEDGDAADRR